MSSKMGLFKTSGNKRSAAKAAVEFTVTCSVIMIKQATIDEIEFSITKALEHTSQNTYELFDEESFSTLDILWITPSEKDNPSIWMYFSITFYPIVGLAVKWNTSLKEEIEQVLEYSLQSVMSWVEHAKVFLVNVTVTETAIEFEAKTITYSKYIKHLDWKHNGAQSRIKEVIKTMNAELYLTLYFANLESQGSETSELTFIATDSAFSADKNATIGLIILNESFSTIREFREKVSPIDKKSYL